MKPNPRYIGNNRILTFVEDNIPIIADSRSIDSLDLILGVDIERDVLPIFAKLLRRNSIFVDVGANFGIYSAIAINRIHPSEGKVFAFEANPLTYDYLTWTLYANQARNNPNIVYRNLAVSNVSGQTVTLNFDPAALGGASIDNCGAVAHQVTAETVTLDDFIPRDVTPTLIKIDVEGHEPHVIAGARETLARSPDVVLIIECFEPLLRYYGVERFIDELRIGHGLDIYLAGPGASLRRLTGDEYPEGDAYIFASKRSLDGVDRALFSFYPEHMHMPSGRVLFHGPYADIPRGSYAVRLIGKIAGTVGITIQSAFGKVVHGVGEISEAQPECLFTLTDDITNFEVVGHGEPGAVIFERIDLYPAPAPATDRLADAPAVKPPGFASKAWRWICRRQRRR